MQQDLPVMARQQPNGIAQIDEAEYAFQQVVAVGTAADDA